MLYQTSGSPEEGSRYIFYSQHPDGTLDNMATHGGCPVLEGTKWASNLWIWNKAMPFGSSRSNQKMMMIVARASRSRSLLLVSSAEMFWVGGGGEEAPMGTVSAGDNLRLNPLWGIRLWRGANGAEVFASVARGRARGPCLPKFIVWLALFCGCDGFFTAADSAARGTGGKTFAARWTLLQR